MSETTKLVPVTLHKPMHGTVVRWLKDVGEQVELNEPLVKISTKRRTSSIAAPSSGVLHEIIVHEGDMIDRAAKLATIKVSLDGTTETRFRFGNVIRGLRQSKGWSQEDLARRMTAMGHAMHQVTVGKMEKGKRPTSIDEVVALATIFGVTPGDLLRPPGSKAAMDKVHVAMGEVAQLYDKLQQARQAEQELHAHLKQLRVAHADAVKRYHAVRREAGPDAPRLPPYMEAGRRPQGVDMATIEYLYEGEPTAGPRARLWFSDGTEAEVDG